MPAARTGTNRNVGTVKWVPPTAAEPGHFKIRIRLADGSRPWEHLPPNVGELEARATAVRVGKLAKIGGYVAKPKPAKGDAAPGESCEKWWERYLDHRESKGQVTVGDSRTRVSKWILPHLDGRAMRDVTRADLERVVTALDAAVLAGAIRWKTAGNVWGEVTSAFAAACKSKVTSLRVRDDNPAQLVQGPDRGDDRIIPALYPEELLTLVASDAVPLARRRSYALAVYIAARASELEALTAADVDFVHKRARIEKQVDQKTKRDRKTKAKKVRGFDIEPNIEPLLSAMAKERPTGRMLTDLPRAGDRANVLRDDARAAGLTRAELYRDDDTHAPLVFHALRHTGLTWMGVRGDDAVSIQRRGGHSDFETTQGYLDAGRDLAGGFGVPFPILPASLLGPPRDHAEGTFSESIGDSQCQGRGLNPYPQDAQRDEAANRGGPASTRSVEPPPEAPFGPSSDQPRTARLHLADAISAAVREGDLALADRLLTIARGLAGGEGAAVVDLAGERARRGGAT